MKTKKINFDWSIFIAVMTIFVVIICGVVCCCLALPSNDNGIAKAQENVDYLIAPGESYTSSAKCSSIVQNPYLDILQNIIYINFNYQFLEEEFFDFFSDVIDSEYGGENGGLNEDYYCYPLITFQNNHGGNYYNLFTVVILGWSSMSGNNGIYIFDGNVSISDDFIDIIASNNYSLFLDYYGDFIVTSFRSEESSYNGLYGYTNRVSTNLINIEEDFLRIRCYFDSTILTDYFYGVPYEETLLPFLDSLFSLNEVFNNNPLYVAPKVSGNLSDDDYSFEGYAHFNYNIESQYLKIISEEFLSYMRDDNPYIYNDIYGLVYILASYTVSDDPFEYYFGFYDDGMRFVIISEEEGFCSLPYGIHLDTFLPFANNAGHTYLSTPNYGFSYISPFWYSDYCSLDIGMFFSMSDNFLSYGDVQVLKQQKQYNQQLAQKDEVIDSLQESIAYYESLELNYRYVPINYLAGIKTYSFTKDGINYSSNSIERSSNAREIYNSYNNAQLDVPPESMGVCFAVELDKTYSNVKFKFSPIIDCYYQYTLCSEPDDSGTQQCYQHNGIFNGINVGYVRQNGEIVFIGSYSSLPGSSDGEFDIHYPTNTLVFYKNGMTQITLPDDFTLGFYMYDPDKIYNDGYDAGFDKGYSEGKNVGYYEGLGADTDISFFALLSSVVDAPIQMIVGKWNPVTEQMEGGMLNFYIPGLDINIAPFLLSMFTICLIVMIIRFILARRE